VNTRIGILRFAAYAVLVAGVAGIVYWSGVSAPGGLQIMVIPERGAVLGTSEFSIVEQLQHILVAFCGLVFGWVAFRDRLRRPMAVGFVALFTLFLVRELDFFMDRYVADNLWQVLSGLVVVLAGVYLVRHRGRLEAGWHRSWPSAGLAILLAGVILLIPYVQILASEALWQALMAERYSRAAKLAFEELSELGAYLMITIGCLEFLYAWSRLPQTRTIDRPRRGRRAG
jgi:hypothetical protein